MIAASFPFTGAWYDIARADSLFLAMVVSVLYLVRFHASSRWACLGAGVLIVAAFYTKQTASLFGVAAGLALLAQTFWGAAIYGVTAGALWGGLVALHQGHRRLVLALDLPDAPEARLQRRARL